MRLYLFTLAIGGLFAFTACEQDQAAPQPEAAAFENAAFIVDENEDGNTNLPAIQFEEALSDHSAHGSADYFNAVKKVIERPDGTTDVRYVVDEDIELTEEEMRTLQGMNTALEKQYRTYNLVSDNYITVIGYTGGAYALTSTMRTALEWAVNNYNNLNTTKTFSLSFSASTNADMIVYREYTESGAGGRAGFPAGGQPYKWIRIYAGMDNYDTNTNEHVITHEMGHAMGLRHTDWYSRESCNQTGESSGSDGAVQIPGTPSGFDVNSVMLACFGSNEDGEFGYYDRVALESMY